MQEGLLSMAWMRRSTCPLRVSLARGPALDDVDGIAACVLTPQEALARRGEIEGGIGRCYTVGNVERAVSTCSEADGKKGGGRHGDRPDEAGTRERIPQAVQRRRLSHREHSPHPIGDMPVLRCAERTRGNPLQGMRSAFAAPTRHLHPERVGGRETEAAVCGVLATSLIAVARHLASLAAVAYRAASPTAAACWMARLTGYGIPGGEAAVCDMPGGEDGGCGVDEWQG